MQSTRNAGRMRKHRISNTLWMITRSIQEQRSNFFMSLSKKLFHWTFHWSNMTSCTGISTILANCNTCTDIHDHPDHTKCIRTKKQYLYALFKCLCRIHSSNLSLLVHCKLFRWSYLTSCTWISTILPNSNTWTDILDHLIIRSV